MKRKERRETDEVKQSTLKGEKDKEAPPSKKGRKTRNGPEKDVKEEGFDAKEFKTSYLLPLTKLNDHISCRICKGYFVDATTVIECLHTFCKSCLLKHFEEVDNNCPQCGELIHQSHPSHYVALDRTMQDIVYRLVPGMFAEEKKRRFDFIRRKNKKEGIVEDLEAEKKKKDEPMVGAYNKCFEGKAILSHHRDGDQTVVELSPGEGLKKAARNIIRLSSLATINTLKRYLAMCLWNDVSRYQELDIFCNNELMGKDFSMKFIRMTSSMTLTETKIIRVYACDGFCGDGQFWPLTRCCEKNDFFGEAGGECQGSRAFCDIGF